MGTLLLSKPSAMTVCIDMLLDGYSHHAWTVYAPTLLARMISVSQPSPVPLCKAVNGCTDIYTPSLTLVKLCS
jgi:hypothetical protein